MMLLISWWEGSSCTLTWQMFFYGRQPVSIDIITRLKGVEFDVAFPHTQVFNEEGLNIRFIHLSDLIQAKKAAGRYKDLDDLEKLSANQ